MNDAVLSLGRPEGVDVFHSVRHARVEEMPRALAQVMRDHLMSARGKDLSDGGDGVREVLYCIWLHDLEDGASYVSHVAAYWADHDVKLSDCDLYLDVYSDETFEQTCEDLSTILTDHLR